MEIQINLTGILKDLAGKKVLFVSGCSKLSDLKKEIVNKHPEFSGYKYNLFINKEMPEGDPVLKEGDEISLIPPFAGG